MKVQLCLIVLLAVAFTACKSKKNLAKSSANSVSTIENMQYDAYRNKLPGTQVERVDKNGIRVTFDSEILFPTNSSYLTDKAKEDIKNLVDVIRKQGPVKIVIEGHSDKTGTPEYNKWLSDKRAVSVKALAVALGLNGDNISTVGYGDTKPVADNRTPEGRAKNRRVELIITPVS
ncbi:OmpA family protein [Pararcticibacter amylolyticus]|uniref:OmpA family protein n=1 Tax=Pararcticibacter amylolyticus TaxID=2173175 RepID=A0A2U2PHX0_9SPHI|nr:OmpA family protein [Pararcticibacter amylolyticus]PWG81006.1 OmpA family protein [Pararcticibacter amylolyticus]